MFKIVERDWLMNLRGTGYRFDKTNDNKRMKREKWRQVFIYDNAMKNCNVKINDNIFFKGELFPLKGKSQHFTKFDIW